VIGLVDLSWQALLVCGINAGQLLRWRAARYQILSEPATATTRRTSFR